LTVNPASSEKGLGLIGTCRAGWRIAAMVAWLILCLPLYYVWKLTGRGNPWPRRFLAGVARLAGVEIHTHGRRPTGGEFLLANHVSWIDIPAIAAASGAAFVAHDGLASVPLVRWLCRMNRTVFIARHDRASVHQQVQQVRDAVMNAGALAIFPEGTTSDGTSLLPFKSSLLSALDPPPPGVAVQPVLLDYGPEAARIAWVGEESGVANFLKILARSQPVRLNVRFLEPLRGEALANRKAMAAASRAEMLAALTGARTETLSHPSA
jgi:1-acyl-sn-glycerol-3-phosphate acyltransferase